LVRDHASVANRIQKLIESANIKLGQVATNVLGLSGKLMLQALANGEEDAEKLALLARGKLKSKIARLKQSLTGNLTPTQHFLLNELLQQYDQQQSAIDRTNAEIQRQMQNRSDPFMERAVKLLQTVPGIGQRVAETLISEIGTDMTRFPTAAHLASWAGMCPGNHQSAGKQDQEGKHLRARSTNTSSLGGGPHEEDIPVGAIPAIDHAAWEEAGIGSSRP
jgi:transposase